MKINKNNLKFKLFKIYYLQSYTIVGNVSDYLKSCHIFFNFYNNPPINDVYLI